MRDCAYETNVALSSFGRVIRGHTALTSECGSMLEEVLCFNIVLLISLFYHGVLFVTIMFYDGNYFLYNPQLYDTLGF